MKRGIRRAAWALVAIVLALRGTAAADDVSDEPYQLPLVGPYAIYTQDSDFIKQDSGRYQLVELTGNFGRSTLVPNVGQLAVSGSFIVGKIESGWFIFDTRPQHPEPSLFTTLESWQSALSAAGISSNIQLSTPDSLAAGQPDQVLRPWRYRMMQSLLGFSDDAWCNIVQLMGAFAALIVGLHGCTRRKMMPIAIGIAVLVDVIAFLFINGGGPEVILALFLYPVYFFFIIMLGQGIRRLVQWTSGFAGSG